MLLYVTTGEGKERKARPLHIIPETVNRLYDLGMREHERAVCLLHPDGSGWADTPDWRFDRQVIRVALFCRERLHVDAGERVAVLGPLRPLWLQADFALLGLGATAVGLRPELDDAGLAATLNEGSVRVAFATDVASAARLRGLRFRVPSLRTVIGPEGGPEDASFVPLTRLFDLGATLDTAEHASRFRDLARAIEPGHEACWHQAPGGGPGQPLRLERLTHGEAMALVRDRLVRFPSQNGDLAYFAGEDVSLATRIAWYAFAGDGYTTMVLGPSGRIREEAAGLRPARILASPARVEELRRHLESSPESMLETLATHLPALGSRLRDWAREHRIRRAGKEQLGDRLRSVEPLGARSEDFGRSGPGSRSGLTADHRGR